MGGILSKTFVQGRKRRAKVFVGRSSWKEPALPVWRSKSQTAFGSGACVPPLRIAHHARPRLGHGSTEARTEPSAANRGAGMLRLTEKPPAFSQGSMSLSRIEGEREVEDQISRGHAKRKLPCVSGTFKPDHAGGDLAGLEDCVLEGQRQDLRPRGQDRGAIAGGGLEDVVAEIAWSGRLVGGRREPCAVFGEGNGVARGLGTGFGQEQLVIDNPREFCRIRRRE